MGWDDKGLYSHLCVHDDHIDFSGSIAYLISVVGVESGACCLVPRVRACGLGLYTEQHPWGMYMASKCRRSGG